jgi:hypothetical protein
LPRRKIVKNESVIAVARERAEIRAALPRKRMSLERLALCHIALNGHGPEALGARAEITVAELDHVIIGGTFADTLALSRPLLDIYEEEAHVRRIA